MGSFEAKICRKRPRKTENKNYRSVSFLPGTKRENSKKIVKKLKKLKNTIMDSFQEKEGWKKM